MATSRTFQNLLTSTNIADATDITKKVALSLTGITTATTRTWTFDDANGTFVGTANTQTLSNKTLSAPIVSGDIVFDEATNDLTLAVADQATGTATATIPDMGGVSQDVVLTSQTQTLSNKTMTAPTFDNGFVMNDSNDSHTYTISPGDITSAATLTLPADAVFDGDFNQEIVLVDGLQTLTKKTLTSPTVTSPTYTNNALTFENAGSDVTLTVASQSAGSGSFTLPDLNGATSPIVVTNVAQTLTLKTFNDSTQFNDVLSIQDSSNSFNYTLTAGALGANRILNIPDLSQNDTLVVTTQAQDLANKTLVLPKIHDTSADHHYVFAVNELTADRTVTLPLLAGNDTFVFASHAETLSNKTLSAPIVSGDITFDETTNDLTLAVTDQGTGTATATIPDLGGVSQDFVFTSQTQTLSNKTFTSVGSIGGLAGQNLVITPPAGYNVTISGDLDVTGTTTSIDSVNVNIADRYLYLNKDYTTAAAVTSGFVVNHTPTATATVVDTGGFASTTTVTVSDDTGFAAGDIIQISNANNPANDGIYEVSSTLANVITIKGAPAEDFIQTAFTVDTTVQGAVTKISVCVLRVGTDGIFEVGCGSTTPISYNDLLTTSTADSVSTATVSTTDATVTQIATIATSSNKSYLVDADIISRETDDSDESGAYKLRAHYRNDGGTLTQVGGDDLVAFESTAGWNVSTTVDTTNIDINVQGAAATNVSWSVSYKVREI